ncbi:hypothetical protein SAMN05443428_101170 [Caloramator quimbayensis]|uniref:Uncharacterized protein n=1 Tax=Caloramator quimbayensis TaxID=1147123 RepID=A0A1T4WG16_9CLOT|nr:CLC_0170 family protein [Caloramator quimbayensis]SKA76274.1 hypothetical protein SAMN05443428_101170 [Caloramator quimbayensis]
MEVILKFIVDTFDLTVYILFIISSMFLIFIDCREYKKMKLNREYKFARNTAIVYLILGTILYIAARYIKI